MKEKQFRELQDWFVTALRVENLKLIEFITSRLSALHEDDNLQIQSIGKVANDIRDTDTLLKLLLNYLELEVETTTKPYRIRKFRKR